MKTQTRTLVTLSVILTAALIVVVGCGAPYSVESTIRPNNRIKVTASSDTGTADLSEEDGDGVVTIGNHKIKVGKETVSIDSQMACETPQDTKHVDVKIEKGVITITADGKEIMTHEPN